MVRPTSPLEEHSVLSVVLLLIDHVSLAKFDANVVKSDDLLVVPRMTFFLTPARG